MNCISLSIVLSFAFCTQLSIAQSKAVQSQTDLVGKAIRAMQSNQVLAADATGEKFIVKVRDRRSNDIYGLGEWREEVNAQGEATLISSPSWAGAYPWIDFKNKLYGFFITHITGFKNGFSSFHASPVLPLMVRDALQGSSPASF